MILQIFALFFISPLSEFSFYIKAITRLFIVKLNDKSVFNSPNSKKQIKSWRKLSVMISSLKNNEI